MAKSPRRERQLEGFAEDLGRLLGTAQAKAQSWMGQRRTIAKQLQEIRDTASGLLAELTNASIAKRRGRRSVAAAVDGVVANVLRRQRKLSATA